MITVHRQHSPARVAGRFVVGRDVLGGRSTDATFLSDSVTSVTASRWACLAGWKRSAIRLGSTVATPPLLYSVATDPHTWANSAGAIGTVLAGRATISTAEAARHRRFRSLYVRPLTLTVRRQVPGARVHVSRELAGLEARLLRPVSPAGRQIREWYGDHLQPYARWVPDHAMRGYWWAHGRTEPFRNHLDRFRAPRTPLPARVEITVPSGFVTKEQRDYLRQAVVAKLGLSDLIESWDQVGRVAVGTWTVRERPPKEVFFEHIEAFLAGRPEHEFVVGLTAGGRPVYISLDDDAPHIACSAGSGAGKSVLAKLLAMQVLAKGGRVTIFDRKGSHRWARNLPGVTYCTQPAQMHAEWLRLSAQADQRNEQAMHEEEGWDPGHREFVIFEEMNATVPQLRQYWEDVREKSDPKQSPAIVAFRNVMFMGRSAKTNIFGVAQMLTANTTGGPESRENFGVRALARYTANNWKMLAPECPMPRKSRTRGRWQIVIAGEAIETQVAYTTDREVIDYLAAVPVSPNSQTSAEQPQRTGTTPHVDTLTLEEARDRFCPNVNVDTLKKRRSRARAKGGAGPKAARTRGRAELYTPDEIRRWLIDESLIEPEISHAE